MTHLLTADDLAAIRERRATAICALYRLAQGQGRRSMPTRENDDDDDVVLYDVLDDIIVLLRHSDALAARLAVVEAERDRRPVVEAAQRAIVEASRERARLLAAPEAGLISDDWFAAWWEASDRIYAAVAALAYLLDPAAEQEEA